MAIKPLTPPPGEWNIMPRAGMTWAEFKAAIEAGGVTDDMVVAFIEWKAGQPEVLINEETGRFYVH